MLPLRESHLFVLVVSTVHLLSDILYSLLIYLA